MSNCFYNIHGHVSLDRTKNVATSANTIVACNLKSNTIEAQSVTLPLGALGVGGGTGVPDLTTIDAVDITTTNITADTGVFDVLTANTGNITTVNLTTLNADTGNFDTLNNTDVTTTTLTATTATIGDVTANNVVTTGTISGPTIDNLQTQIDNIIGNIGFGYRQAAVVAYNLGVYNVVEFDTIDLQNTDYITYAAGVFTAVVDGTYLFTLEARSSVINTLVVITKNGDDPSLTTTVSYGKIQGSALINSTAIFSVTAAETFTLYIFNPGSNFNSPTNTANPTKLFFVKVD